MNLHVNRRPSHRRGVILLVVLGSLTFFSILIAAYLVFSNESRDASFALSQQEIREPDVDWMMNEALMKLVRGTDDPTDPFYGEDLLSDYYGVKDSFGVQILEVEPIQLFDGLNPNTSPLFVRIGVSVVGSPPPHIRRYDGVFAGLVLTLPVQSDSPTRSFRIASSRYQTADNHYLIIKLDDGTTVGDITIGRSAIVNGRARNGKSASYRDATNGGSAATTKNALGGIADLPIALQPNQIYPGANNNKSPINDNGASDFDEDYDAADYNNWFLSHRVDASSGDVIPSFHRPSVINYLLNQAGASNTPDLFASLARATFRPLPFASLNNRSFTGGNPNYALRVPYDANAISPAKMQQLLTALIDGQWDVDNDSDGNADSIWIDLGIPEFVTREGKLIKPLVAPMIEDLSGRLNLNAHGNPQLSQLANVAGIGASNNVYWAREVPTALQPNPPLPTRLFRGNGWGPAEITLPTMTGPDGTDLLAQRYGYGVRKQGNAAGVAGRDALDILQAGFRPPWHQGDTGFGYTTDPFGRSAVGIGKSGHVIMAPLAFDATREDTDHPYESDPSGRLAGDDIFSFADLEPILRSNDFDSELLPPEVRRRLQVLLATNPNYRHAFTTNSSSDDSPVVSLLELILTRFPGVGGTTDLATKQAVLRALVPPETRLGRKLDVNRPVGNLHDDNGNGIIDEPGEQDLEAFRVAQNATGTVPNQFTSQFIGQQPFYMWDVPQAGGLIPVTGRQLLARHLYVLLMALRSSPDGGATSATLPMLDSPEGVDDDELYTARRLAQWAVNVVDYRDPDSVMTRFAFDPNPFDADGWSVDESVTPASAQFVVWGVEEPQLLFSEGLALHDVRVRDTERDASEEFKLDDEDDPEDETTDQVRIPQGSLFLELYCPHPVPSTAEGRGEPGFPQEFYEFPNGSPALRLDKTHNGNVNGTPVWRIAISEQHAEGDEAALSPLQLRNRNLNSASFEPNQPDELSNLGDTLSYDRFIWFGGPNNRVNVNDPDQPTGDLYNWIQDRLTLNNLQAEMQASQVFLAPNLEVDGDPVTQNRYLLPGQFLVLAPRTETYLGSKFQVGNPNSNAGGNGQGNAFGLRNRISPAGRSDQSLNINFNYGIRHTNTAGQWLDRDAGLPQDQFYGRIANTLVVAAPRPTTFTRNNFRDGLVGLNISEPLPWSVDYYQRPIKRYFGNNHPLSDDYDLLDAYTDMTEQHDPLLPVPNIPLDVDNPHLPDIQDEPVLGTLDNYRTAYLQRLADPTLPFNSVTNPYRTVDWLTLDLTVYSGEEKEGIVTNNQDGQDPVSYARRSRQRNGRLRQTVPPNPDSLNAYNVLFSYETTDPTADQQVLDTTGFNDGEGEYFSFNQQDGSGYLYTTLNFLNTQHPVLNPNVVCFATPLGRLSVEVGMNSNLPGVPYATHPWLNRPFASDHELMLVPACSASRLFEEFLIPAAGAQPTDVYAPVANGLNPKGNYRHLLNFFFNGTNNSEVNDLELVRLFEFVGTLPRYRGEIDYFGINRGTIYGDPNDANDNGYPQDLALYAPPFNYLYDNQRQATVNLNTVASPEAWQGLMQGHLEDLGNDPNLSFNAFRRQRQGYADAAISKGNPGSGNLRYRRDLDPRFPTRFAGIYRSTFNQRYNDSDVIPSNNALSNPEVNMGLLRNKVIAGGSNRQPMFVRPFPATSDPARNHSRNALLQYQTLTRMPNLVADNSQVFLIRLTLGFFEVQVDGGTKGLGREYNSDTGMSERYKATFVVDRSIPVGFAPGKDLNARNVVVFESYGQ